MNAGVSTIPCAVVSSPARASPSWARSRYAVTPAATSSGTRSRSQDQHRVAEGIEAVALRDRDLVEPARLFDAREGHDERKQRRARQVEVRQEHVDPPKLEARQDEELGATGERRSARERLEDAHGGRPDGEHALGSGHALPRGGRDLVALTVERMLLDLVDRERPEGVQADVKGHPL